MKFLKTLGRLALYAFIFIISPLLASLFLANLYSLLLFSAPIQVQLSFSLQRIWA